MSYLSRYLDEAVRIAKGVNRDGNLDGIVDALVRVRENQGRVFFLGVGGSAANCSHAVNDFRKIARIESYAPTDNVAELTARTNDEGWETVFREYLVISHLGRKDAVFVMSVGGGNKEKNVSVNLIHALDYAREVGSSILGIVGRDGGYAKKVADHCVVIPPISPDTITPHAESWQAVIWHGIVSDPRMLQVSNKWESLDS